MEYGAQTSAHGGESHTLGPSYYEPRRDEPFWHLMVGEAPAPITEKNLEKAYSELTDEDVVFAEWLVSHIASGAGEKSGSGAAIAFSDIANALLELPPKHPLNLQRKSGGNIQQYLRQQKFCAYFSPSGSDNMLQLAQPKRLHRAYRAGKLSLEVLTRVYEFFDELHRRWLVVLRTNGETLCCRCNSNYKMSIAEQPLCSAGGKHDPLYDWTRSTDVEACRLK